MSDIDERISSNALAMIAEDDRLRGLSNAELVAECMKLDASWHPVIEEMMNRLDPEWFKYEAPLSPGKLDAIKAALEKVPQLVEEMESNTNTQS